MRIGFFHLGPAQHGIRRYGERLAAELRRLPGLDLFEVAPASAGGALGLLGPIARSARQLSGADLIHLQFSSHCPPLWGGGRSSGLKLACFLAACRAPVVVTLHDLRGPYQDVPWDREQRIGPWLAPVLRRARRVYVCSEAEASRAHRLGELLEIIPHFVEPRGLPEYGDARERLGIGAERIVTLLGFIFRRKGYELLIEALAGLPQDVRAVFAGRVSETTPSDLQRLRRAAERFGVTDRVKITGYLTDSEQDLYMAATDLAVCPFLALGASGSLSTWIGSGRPILASELAQIAEYNRLEPGAIATFSPASARELGRRIAQLLPSCGPSRDPAVLRLREKLSLRRIAQRHLESYETVLRV